jgi:hypothetical protein
LPQLEYNCPVWRRSLRNVKRNWSAVGLLFHPPNKKIKTTIF